MEFVHFAKISSLVKILTQDTLPEGGTSLETHTLHLHERWMVDTIVVRAKTDYNREMTTLFGHLLNDSECVCVSSQSIAW